jgi:hypothetical protein
MTIQVTAKQVGNNGSTTANRVVLNVYEADHTLNDSNFTFTNDNGSVVMQARRIESVMNCGPSPVTIDGRQYETGRWELSMIGGVQLAATNSCAIVFDNTATGNVFIEFRS